MKDATTNSTRSANSSPNCVCKMQTFIMETASISTSMFRGKNNQTKPSNLLTSQKCGWMSMSAMGTTREDTLMKLGRVGLKLSRLI